MNKERILFLDIDGVLNSVTFAMKGNCNGVLGIDPETIPHLQRIVDETDCAIVISSTWRILHSLADIRGKLIAAGMRHPCPVVDKTPRLKDFDAERGHEVAQWIETTGFDGTYVCIDDDSDFLEGQPLVKTNNHIGLTAAHADRCIAILKG